MNKEKLKKIAEEILIEDEIEFDEVVEFKLEEEGFTRISYKNLKRAQKTKTSLCKNKFLKWLDINMACDERSPEDIVFSYDLSYIRLFKYLLEKI